VSLIRCGMSLQIGGLHDVGDAFGPGSRQRSWRRPMTNRDLQSRIGNDIGDFADLIVRKASKQPTKEHRYGNVPVSEK
jgi:hypothetical protein